MRNLITGGAGFIGSNLINKLINSGEEIICLDDFSTGNIDNIRPWLSYPNFELIEHDLKKYINLFNIDRIWHLGSPASPAYYEKNPIETTQTIFCGTLNMLELAKNNKARMLFLSSSEIYGNGKENNLKETYLGSVNPIGKRSCYAEGKRIAESLCFDYLRKFSTSICIARVFNTYGPRMSKNDGRVISNFINQGLSNLPFSIFGDGTQTRSFCFIDDTLDGLMKLMNSSFSGPINLGNPFEEMSIIDLAELIKKKTNSKNLLKFLPLPSDDPKRRKPNIYIANELLNWKPSTSINIGLDNTINYFIKN